jgi:hypothetical protein
MINLKNNIWIEGFDTEIELFRFWHRNVHIFNGDDKDLQEIYFGKTSDIPEDIANDVVTYIMLSTGIFYLNYRKMVELRKPIRQRNRSHNEIIWEPMCKTAIESIQSACNQEYCIIFTK